MALLKNHPYQAYLLGEDVLNEMTREISRSCALLVWLTEGWAKDLFPAASDKNPQLLRLDCPEDAWWSLYIRQPSVFVEISFFWRGNRVCNWSEGQLKFDREKLVDVPTIHDNLPTLFTGMCGNFPVLSFKLRNLQMLAEKKKTDNGF